VGAIPRALLPAAKQWLCIVQNDQTLRMPRQFQKQAEDQTQQERRCSMFGRINISVDAHQIEDAVKLAIRIRNDCTTDGSNVERISVRTPKGDNNARVSVKKIEHMIVPLSKRDFSVVPVNA
jgi:hypothetical protein